MTDAAREVPLVVDLDGTLVRSDTLHEGVARLLKRRPLALLLLPWWLRRGRAAVKQEVAARTALDPGALPYEAGLIERLREERRRRPLVLCTAAHRSVADAVATHLALFDEVIATEHGTNLKGAAKAAALVARFGAAGFDYAGNDAADLPVFAAARGAWVVAPTAALRRRLGEVPNRRETLADRPRDLVRAALRALRPHQWVKNLLVFVPMLAAMQVTYADALPEALLAFAAFSLVASGVYLVNDLLDLDADRRHPRKRHRPLAAGTLPLAWGGVLAVACVAAGFGLASRLPGLFAAALGLYAAATTLYTYWLKRVPILDTIVLAGLYTLRILAGAAAIMVVPSVWLLAFSMFFFLSLALAKRHSELVELDARDALHGIPGREYGHDDLATIISQGTASGYAAVLVLALFVDSAHVQARYRHPELIWLICPLLLYWINKLWLNSQRRQINDDPVVWALTNRVSLAIAGLATVLLLAARWLPVDWGVLRP